MRSRKTVEVEEVKKWANGILAREDEYADAKFKAGVCTLLEGVLHQSGNYRGFCFLVDDVRPSDAGYYTRRYF